MLERTAGLIGLALSFACSSQSPLSNEPCFGGAGGQAASGAAGISSGGSTTAGPAGGSLNAGGGGASGGQAPLPQGGAGGGATGGGNSSGGTLTAQGGAAGAAGFPPDVPGKAAAPFTFPQNHRSSHCVYPAGVSSQAARVAYERWKTDLVRMDGKTGFRRVIRPDVENNAANTTVSEGIGYGMILAVVMDDQALFDDFWKYSQQHLNERGLMHWLIGEDGSVMGSGAATDADEDIAWALAQADKKWGGKGSLDKDYLELAKGQIKKIWDHEVDHGRGELLLAGDSWGGIVPFNPSYFAPNQYRLFGKLTDNEAGWSQVIDRGYELLTKTLTSSSGNQDNGLIAAWTNDQGAPAAPFDGAPLHYQYDSARIPFRIGMDFCEFGEPRAKAYLAKTSTFFSGVGASNIVDGYELNGTPKPENPDKQSALFVGAAAVGAMSDAGYQPFVDASYGLLASKDMRPKSYYFNLSWEVFSLLMLSGNLFDYSLHTP